MAQLAIRGNATRGKEVIELLEMLGGVNKENYRGNASHDYYYINDKYIDWKKRKYFEDDFIFYTLEEFLEKFPYKIGDTVILDGSKCIIRTMSWCDSEVLYLTNFCGGYAEYASKLCPFKKDIITHKTQVEVNHYLKNITIKNAQNLLDIEKYLNNDGLKLPDNVSINKNGIGSIEFIKWYKDKQYPKTYEECLQVLGFDDHCIDIKAVNTKEYILHTSFIKLLRCRDAYWRIADNWKPYFSEDFMYSISSSCGLIEKKIVTGGGILVFPTEEMRNIFCENFNLLIKRCKELL